MSWAVTYLDEGTRSILAGGFPSEQAVTEWYDSDGCGLNTGERYDLDCQIEEVIDEQ